MLRYLITCILVMLLMPIAQGRKPISDDAVSSKHFTFRAQSVTSVHGLSRTLTPEYTLRVTKDSIICFLPYFGAQYNTPSSDDLMYGGYKFTATNYTWQVTNGKHGASYISISAKTDRDKIQLTLNVFKNGWADLRITSAGRDPISYYGTLVP